MTSKARQKVDPNVRDMFDAEVDRPDHDRLMLTLFNDEAGLRTILSELHAAKPLPAITPQSTFSIDPHSPNARRVTYAEAVSLTGGVEPSWNDRSPIRILPKRLEVPMEYRSADGRYGRVVGFIDVGVIYRVMKSLYITEERGGRYAWQPSYSEHIAMMEVKSAWPTVGNLVRQLQLYRIAEPVGFRERPRINIVVGPDDSVNEVLCEHQFRLVTFNSTAANFELVPTTQPSERGEPAPGRF